MTFDQFCSAYLDDLSLLDGIGRGQEYDLYGYKPAGVLSFLNNLNETKAQAHNILRTRASVQRMSNQRCKNAVRSDHLWELSTVGGVRFLYFRDGPRLLIVVSGTPKMKEKKFNAEIERADAFRSEYLILKEKMLK